MPEEEISIEKLRHSTAHILATAVTRLYPEAKLGIGVTTEKGFFHDFEFPKPITQDELTEIESEMNSIVIEKLPFRQIVLPKETAIHTLLQRGQIYKAELLQDNNEEEISFYMTGNEFIDLCRGPHIEHSGQLGTFKLQDISGAYWKGDESRPQLQRITGLAFFSDDDLEKHLTNATILKELDFRRIGQSLEYLVTVGKQIVYTEHGTHIYRSIVNSLETAAKESGYNEVILPICREDYAQRFKDIFSIRNRSYRELPLRHFSNSTFLPQEPVAIAEKTIAILHYFLLHTIAKETEYEKVIREQVKLLVEIFKILKLEISIHVYSPDKKNDFINVISSQLEQLHLSHSLVIDMKRKKVAMEITIKDEFGRIWNPAFMEVEYPASTKYTSREGELVPTLNIQSEINIEALIGYFLEREQGGLPFWLSPRKAIIIPISEKHYEYADTVSQVLTDLGITNLIDNRSEKMQAKIRDAELKKFPLIIVLGDKEKQNHTLSVRLRGQNDIGMIDLNELDELIKKID